jgi:hypothetical protein
MSEKRPPVVVTTRNPKNNYCPRKIAQHRGGCYCMTLICCGVLSDEPHATDCGGVITVMEEEHE